MLRTAHSPRHAPQRPAKRRRVVAGVAAGLAAALLASGCASSDGSSKPAKPAQRPVVLHLATIDSVNSNGQIVAPTTFIKALRRLSGGRLTARVQNDFEEGQVGAETDIVKGIAAGTLDGGWPSSRAFARAGLQGLQPIEAPLTLTSYAAEKALVSGGEGRTLLRTLNGSGVVGLGLTVGPLRRPWSVKKPLVDPRAWQGQTFRSYNSPVQEATIRALGGRPVKASYNFPDLVASGRLQGTEADVAQYNVNEYGDLLPHAVSNVVLWPRVLVLALSQKRFDSLDARQRGWVTRAAREAVTASVAFPFNDSSQAAALCGPGVRFAMASAQQLASLHQAVRSVIKSLAHDTSTRSSMVAVQRVARRFPDPDVLKVPASCRAP